MSIGLIVVIVLGVLAQSAGPKMSAEKSLGVLGSSSLQKGFSATRGLVMSSCRLPTKVRP
jgi:hypothetical protein